MTLVPNLAEDDIISETWVDSVTALGDSAPEALSTSQRLALTGSRRLAGKRVLDTTLGRWFYWNGTAWIYDGGNVPKVCARKTTTQAVAAVTATAISFPTADLYDSDNLHDPLTNNTRITIPAGLGGLWRVSYSLYVAASVVGAGQSWIAVNAGGERHAWSGYSISSATHDLGLTGSVDLQLVAGDYVECQVYNTTARTFGIVGFTNFLQATYIGE